MLAPKGHVRVPTGGRCQVRSLTGAAYTYVGARGRAILRRDTLSGDTPERGANVHILVTEPVEPLGSTLYLFGQLRWSGLVGDRHNYLKSFTSALFFKVVLY